MSASTTTHRPNRYAGPCAKCGHRVEAEAGVLGGQPGGWFVLHADDECDPTPVAPPAPAPQLVPGVYVLDGQVLKVQERRDKRGVYTLRWHEISGERLLDHDGVSRVQGEWEYAPSFKAVLTDDHRMTLDEAKAFILRYGICARCGRKLKAAESVERGIGPVCAKYFSFGHDLAA